MGAWARGGAGFLGGGSVGGLPLAAWARGGSGDLGGGAGGLPFLKLGLI